MSKKSQRNANADNTKPVLYATGENDPVARPEVVQMIADSMGGPVTVEVFADAGHQLMLFETEAFSNCLYEFCTEAIASE